MHRVHEADLELKANAVTLVVLHARLVCVLEMHNGIQMSIQISSMLSALSAVC